jgi:hypothetical protein
VSAGASRFYNSINDPTNLEDKKRIGLFAYYLTVEAGEANVSAKSIDDCFIACDLTPPGRTAAYLSEGVSAGNFVKANPGYKLQRHYREELSRMLGAERVVVQTSVDLRKLEARIDAGSTRGFVTETIDCFEAGANRATIVMCWILAVDHLIAYVLKHHVAAFNVVLASNNDRRVKVRSVSSRDDFSDIPEGKLIEFLRSASIISADVRKILEEKLGIRNSSAHPSGISIKRSKVIEFVDDLIENVVLKYKI